MTVDTGQPEQSYLAASHESFPDLGLLPDTLDDESLQNVHHESR